ncbi:MAG: hypothetical protein HN956_22580, partial [Rhodospirillaceae bacterium]|nr:hypothetical protein [Rhodospirillaceae bacterium]
MSDIIKNGPGDNSGANTGTNADHDDQERHWVSDAPFNPHTIERLTKEQERFFMASQWTLMWWKLRRHPLAVA